jgi:hypothetical protein
MEHIQKTIETMTAKLAEQEAVVVETKKLINSLCGVLGQPTRFADLTVKASIAGGGFKRDDFYGQPLSGVVRRILESRKASGDGPAAVAEIYDAMIQGGFQFEAASADNAKRALRISLTKNTQTFHKLPTGHYGLREWYPNIKEPKQKNGNATEVSAEPDGSEDSEFDFAQREKEMEKARAASQKATA